MNADERLELVKRHMAEVVTEDELEDLVQQEDPSAYIGYAPTGMMHIGHFTTVRKIADFVDAGFTFTFLIADIHAELDVEKSPLDLVPARAEYYETAIRGMLDASGVDPDAVDFMRGSDYQHDAGYQKGYMRIMEQTTVNRAQRAVNEVVRHSESMKASGLLYAAMQIMDCAALDIDVAYAGTDQRRIYMLGRETLPDIGEDKPTCVFAPLLSGLTGGKMSASEEASKISIHDDADTVQEKINDAYAPAGEVEDNGVLEYVRYLVFPILQQRGETFQVERPDEYGGTVEFDEYSALEQAYVAEDLHPADLKEAAARYIAGILEDVQERFDGKEDLLRTAYPDEYSG
ncbi:MAG: tyrosine--tRNA ligase [Candidatus Nanohaloarchaea archaeon]|nr:tyrosine--tRNA ligase [Candidatus Nanohaloarchaea archaeon]